jgi:hypothetical protein
MGKKRKSRTRERRLDVYVIRNTETGGVYVGVSCNARMRFKQHLGKTVRVGCLAILEEALRGAEFEMTVIVRCGFFDALIREKREIANARAAGLFVYNQTDGGEYPMSRAEARLLRQRESKGGRIPTSKSVESKRRNAILKAMKEARPKARLPEVSPIPMRQRPFQAMESDE